ncbi:hypothetical protein [Kiritimatiella glycovorans]|uniref:Uncharacterized protein n=1 Tax=Kiritimatiella glycovorans TaxID=1307763 RepID=A0A0G3EDZ8_9BACT|nr:hypothetical protein [Kiritimatiella glycovorans]AKJ63642.1 hypothetical protein L21SP4_00361 [Kiritimatiella glycovorans]
MKRKFLPGIVLGLGIAATCSAEWEKVDDFDTYDHGEPVAGRAGWAVKDAELTGAMAMTDPEHPENRILKFYRRGNGEEHDYLWNAERLRIDRGARGTGTIFMRLFLGRAESSTSVKFGVSHQDFQTPNALKQMVWFRHSGEAGVKPVADADGQPLEGMKIQSGRWYRLWMVVRHGDEGEADADVHLVAEDGSAELHLTEADFVREALPHSVGTDFTRFGFVKGDVDDRAIYLDDVYIDHAGENLTDPTQN